MPVTQDSFRDPRRMYRVRVISPFFITGRKEPTTVGEVVELPRSTAAEIIHSNKGELADNPSPQNGPILRATPPPPPTPQPPAEPVAAAKSTGKEKS